MTQSVTPTDIANWMLQEFERDGVLYQDVAASFIAQRFGSEFTYDNANGNLAIDKAVLDAFRKVTSNDVIWSRSERCWRRREDFDLPGRQQP